LLTEPADQASELAIASVAKQTRGTGRLDEPDRRNASVPSTAGGPRKEASATLRHSGRPSRQISTVAVMAANGPTPVSAQGLAEFESRVASQLPELLDRLLNAPAHPRAGHPQGSVPSAPSIYLFWADGRPVYVGQTRKLRDRLRQHCIPSSSDLSASFAWNLAKREASRTGSLGTQEFNSFETH
jgi:hypothetical protein